MGSSGGSAGVGVGECWSGEGLKWGGGKAS